MENCLNSEFYLRVFLNFPQILLKTTTFSFSFSSLIYFFFLFFSLFFFSFSCFLFLYVFFCYFFNRKYILIHIQLCRWGSEKNFLTQLISRNKTTFLGGLTSLIFILEHSHIGFLSHNDLEIKYCFGQGELSSDC